MPAVVDPPLFCSSSAFIVYEFYDSTHPQEGLAFICGLLPVPQLILVVNYYIVLPGWTILYPTTPHIPDLPSHATTHYAGSPYRITGLLRWDGPYVAMRMTLCLWFCNVIVCSYCHASLCLYPLLPGGGTTTTRNRLCLLHCARHNVVVRLYAATLHCAAVIHIFTALPSTYTRSPYLPAILCFLPATFYSLPPLLC